jgi:hypothetical protein
MNELLPEISYLAEAFFGCAFPQEVVRCTGPIQVLWRTLVRFRM